MQIVITLDGAETKAQVNRIIVGIAALYGQVPPVATAADTLTEVKAAVESQATNTDKLDDPTVAAINAAFGPKTAATTEPDAAAVFGACPLTVAAAVLPTAPVVPQAGVPLPPSASLPPAPPPAPPASAPTVAAPTASVVTDKNGLPWDARIHASTKTFNADGTWRGRRNTDAAIITAVEAELRALMAIPAPAPASIAPVAINSVAPPPPPGAPVSPTTLAEMMPLLTTAMLAGKMQPTAVGEVLAEMGVAGGAPMLAARPDLVPQVWAALSTRFGL